MLLCPMPRAYVTDMPHVFNCYLLISSRQQYLVSLVYIAKLNLKYPNKITTLLIIQTFQHLFSE